LRFSGRATRSAETKPLDLRYGGWVNFHLKFGPDPGTEDCDTALIGQVDLFWAAEITTGVLATNWTKWDTFVPYEFPTDGTWTLVTRELPVEAHSKGTRIMFKQSVFVAKRDHFAIDDLVVGFSSDECVRVCVCAWLIFIFQFISSSPSPNSFDITFVLLLLAS